jgi:predicted ArsR family transcriptional regulator
MSRAYHDTTNTSRADVAQYEQRAQRQDELVRALFRKHSPFPLSPSQAHRALGETFGPLTSLRRAVTNLERDGVLEKLEQTVRGKYGRPEHLWRLKRQPEQARLI